MKKKKIVKVLAVTAGVLVFLGAAGSVVFGGYVADRILHQNKDNDTIDNSLKQLEVWGYDIDGFMNTHEGSQISAQAEDGNIVPATYFDNGSNKCVILVHGAGGDRVSTYPLAEQYIEDGYDVIAIDQRGSGVNPDDRVTFGINERLDIEAMVRYAREALGAAEVIVHGQSMGAQTTAIYASNVTPGDVCAADAVICDSPVPGMELMLRLMFGGSEDAVNSATANYLVGTSKFYMKVFDGIDYDDGDTIAVVADDQLPTLIIVSLQDEVCLPHYVEQIYDNIASDQKDIIYVDSAHIEGVIDDPEGYMDGVEAFLSGAGL
ncbi:MAG: alpha/beta fold hydrolase [Clostridiales bacterium]|nr:alpha/beta fold hydrolase [Clostridiales bacterium]